MHAYWLALPNPLPSHARGQQSRTDGRTHPRATRAVRTHAPSRSIHARGDTLATQWRTALRCPQPASQEHSATRTWFEWSLQHGTRPRAHHAKEEPQAGRQQAPQPAKETGGSERSVQRPRE